MKMLMYSLIVLVLSGSCRKSNDKATTVRYFQVGAKVSMNDWRDTAFVVAADDSQLLAEIDQQLSLPEKQRKLVHGDVVTGSGGFNKNAGHTFNWHFAVNGFRLTDLSAELYDGRPYTDVELDLDYWLRLGFYCPWSMVIKREIKP
jgi:hypothetical protein